MTKFIIRNDDVAFDSDLEEIKRFCETCDKYGYRILHAIIPIGEARKIKSRRMTNDQIKNEGDYSDEIVGLKTCKLSMKKGKRLEDFLNKGVPKSKIMYLHSWRFVEGWYTFDMLEKCLRRLSNSHE